LAGGREGELQHLRSASRSELRDSHVGRLPESVKERLREVVQTPRVEPEVPNGRRVRAARGEQAESNQSLRSLDSSVEGAGQWIEHGVTISTGGRNARRESLMPELFTRITGKDAGWVDCSDRGRLEVSGVDRGRFVNGMVTNEVAALPPGGLCYAALLDRKGRLQADLFVLALEDRFLLDTAPGTGARMLELLREHLVADDVELRDLAGPWSHLAVEGPAARDRLGSVGVEAPQSGRAEVSLWRETPLVWVGQGALTPSGFQVIGPAGAVRDLSNRLGLPELSPEHREALRVEAFIPQYGVDMSERTLPAEARLDRAISVTKGCYVGQEIVARLASRGQVNRLLVQIRTDRPVHPGAAISCGEVHQGEVTSAVVSKASGPLALGYVRAEHAHPGTPLRVGETEGLVVGPPLHRDGAAP
jgi:folate-binding protein YgfZ